MAVVLFLVTSCTVYKEYPIDVFMPGEIELPEDAQNAAIVYRNFKYANDTLQHYYKDNYKLLKAKNDPANLDSLLANSCMEGLAASLKKQQHFDRIHIFPELFQQHYGKKMPPLNLNIIKKLTDETQTDILISLETFSWFYSKYSANNNKAPKPREVITAAVWAVYNPVNMQLIERKTLIDTVYWNSYNDKGQLLKNTKLPPRLEALRIAAQLAGSSYAKRFAPSWKKTKRNYAVPNLADFEAAEKYIAKNNWDNAIALWKRNADANNGRLAVKARYNLALAYEIKDEPETAEKWLDAARELAVAYGSNNDLQHILHYKKILEQRKKEVARLNKLQ
ncbi:MAG: hypothetical protein CSA36_01680 [Draconibacterium sp.]|nr:MAG: hypothetical protein CSA36_01680 [Draconibacterium sp.]